MKITEQQGNISLKIRILQEKNEELEPQKSEDIKSYQTQSIKYVSRIKRLKNDKRNKRLPNMTHVDWKKDQTHTLEINILHEI